MNTYRIFDLNLQIRFAHPDFFEEKFKAYQIDAKPDIVITSRLDEKISEPKGMRVFKNERFVHIRDDDYHHIIMKKRTQIIGLLSFKDDFSHVYMVGIPYAQENKNIDLEYYKLGIVFAHIIAHYNGLMIHGSTIAYQHQAIIFSADSGVGKSTHAKLWQKVFKNDVTIINDDKPALKISEKSIKAYGTPFSGSEHINQNVAYPLKAICFIERSLNNTIRRITPKEALPLLLRQVTRNELDIEGSMKYLELLESVLMQVPLYMLSCNKDDEAARIAQAALFTREGKQ